MGLPGVEAQDGVHALAMLETQTINAVISDWEMPQMDGVALCHQIRQRDFGHYIYAILVTARQSIDDLVQGWNLVPTISSPNRSIRVSCAPDFMPPNAS